MKLSTKTRYGTRLILDLAGSYGEEPSPVWEIAKRLDISPKYLEQIIVPLKKAGLVLATRGAKGGYNLAKPPDRIRLGQVVRLLEPASGLADCIIHPGNCDKSGDCIARMAWSRATRALFRELDSMTFEDLIKDGAGCRSDSDG